MRMVDLIARKRDGRELTTEQIRAFIADYTAGKVPDYQAAALLMAIYLRGMNRRETVDLTQAMAESGEMLDLHDVAPFIIDKHSSGGVGDKTTLALLPLVASTGVPVGKMSGRGLGSSGGTLDKMESFSGWSPALPLPAFRKQLAEIGVVLAGQTADLAPADGKLYALRDVTATVSNKSLIAASIMSKKLAAGADGIVLDVKTGSGAFMATVDAARELAQTMVDIGEDAGRRMVAVLSDMNQPLGHAVGNALEVKEAIATLRGEGPEDFWLHCLELGAHMLVVAGRAPDLDEGRALISEARSSGRGLAKFRELVVAQGGDGRHVDDPSLLPVAAVVEPLLAPRTGWIEAMDTGAIGWATVGLGCGRMIKTDPIDHAAGLVLRAKVGDRFAAGRPMGEIHAPDAEHAAAARDEVLAAITWADHRAPGRPLFHGVIHGKNV